MTTIDFITELFCSVDNNIDDNKHSQAKLYPSEGWDGSAAVSDASYSIISD